MGKSQTKSHILKSQIFPETNLDPSAECQIPSSPQMPKLSVQISNQIPNVFYKNERHCIRFVVFHWKAESSHSELLSLVSHKYNVLVTVTQ